MNYTEFQKMSRPGVIIPVYRKYNADFITAVMAYLKLREPVGTRFYWKVLCGVSSLAVIRFKSGSVSDFKVQQGADDLDS
jgi:hypothetical protein